jgi:ribonuclease HII
VVAAAVRLHRARLPVRVDDSKRLSALQRERAFPHILRHADVGVGIVSAEEIDQHSILTATLSAMQQAVGALSPAPELVLVDGLTAPPLSMPAWPIVHGDARSYPIACASIVAKVVRDSLMAFYHRLLPAYRFDEHKGYGTAVHSRMLNEWGPSWLHRFSFQPVKAVAAHVE